MVHALNPADKGRESTAIDLFAGAGGATEGLKKAGFRVLAAVENNLDASESFAANHQKVRILRQDIREVDPSELRRSLNLEKGELTLLKACPPCQGFSGIGRMDSKDPRNDLTLEVWKFVKEFLPKAFLLENVPGLKSDSRLEALIRQMRGLGYVVRTYTVNAEDFGVPQRRRRLIVVGARGKRAKEELLRLTVIPASRARKNTAGSVLASAFRHQRESDPLNVSQKSGEVVLQRIRAVPIGGNRFDLPKEYILPCHARLKHRNATGSYGRIRADEIAPTMTTRCTTPACGPFIHPTQDRGLTLREAALLQTFPMDYHFVGGYGSIERQIGNAVPVRMAMALGVLIQGLVKSDL